MISKKRRHPLVSAFAISMLAISIFAISVFVISIFKAVFPEPRPQLSNEEYIASKIDSDLLKRGVDCFFPIKIDGKFGVIDRDGNLVARPIFQNVSSGRTASRMANDRLVGQENLILRYLDHWVILRNNGSDYTLMKDQFRFRFAHNHGDGLFSIFRTDSDRPGGFPERLIDLKNQWDASNCEGFGAMGFVDHERIFVGRNGEVRLADRKGNLIDGPSFDLPQPVFYDGLAGVFVGGTKMESGAGMPGDGLIGYVGIDGQFVIPPTFKSATSFDNGKAWATFEGSDDVWVIDREGNRLKKLPINIDLRYFQVGCLEGRKVVKKRREDGGIVQRDGNGLVDIDGNWIATLASGADAHYFSGGVAILRLKKDPLMSLVNRNGERIREMRCGSAGQGFVHGLCAIKTLGKLRYVNPDGEIVWKTEKARSKWKVQ